MHNVASENELSLVKALHSTVPVFSAIFFCIAFCIRGFFAGSQTNTNRLAWRWRFMIGCLIATVLFSYVADALISTLTTTPGDRPPVVQGKLFYSYASSLFWFVNLLWYFDSPASISYPFYGSWVIYLATESLLVWASLKRRLSRTKAETLLESLRLALLLVLVFATLGSRTIATRKRRLDEENTPLLTTQAVSQETGTHGETYGSCNPQGSSSTHPDAGIPVKANNQDKTDVEDDPADEKDKKSLRDVMSFLRAIFPFFWPSGKRGYQFLYIGIGGCLLVERVMNIIIPLQLGLITNLLTQSNGTVPWKEIALFIALRLLQSSGGLPALRTFMWIPLEDLSYLKISTTAFNHIMSLSCDYHDNKSSGQVWQTVIRGQYLKDVVNHICFFVIPTIVDLALAVSILYYLFDAYMALITAALTVTFLWTSGKIINRQRNKRKDLIKKRIAEVNILCQSTDNWKTVSYFNRIPHEQSRYRSAVKDHLKSRVTSRFWDSIENTIQSFLLMLGLMAACLIAAYEVVSGAKPIGSFVMLLSYWAQLSSPLQSLASGFGELVRDMVDAEELLGLLRQKPTIVDSPDAKPLDFEDGRIEFRGVKFSYDGKREVLGNVNFNVSPGQTVAIVGKTGGGKSTILKLLCRFYDPVAGAISIDGQDISKVTLNSLRATLGIVPQDPVLFHDSIMANIRYARLDATDQEIVDACKAVALHEKITSFPDAYDTMVGERGMKLSGGELQRVAIARAMVKNPKVVLLDEATSSVDSETEAHVQRSLKLLCANRTTIVIAHRLSTVVNADQILVVNDGDIIESGNHSDLLKAKGYYHRLCSWQGFAADKPEGAEPPAIFNDMPSIAAPIEGCTDAQTRGESAIGVGFPGVAVIETQKARYPPDTMSQMSPPTSVDKDDMCEHCRHCLDEAASAIESSKSAGRPTRILKPEAPVFVPRAFEAYNLGTSHPYYIQINTAQGASSQRCTNDHPPSGYASDTGESVEIRTGPEKETVFDTVKKDKSDGHDKQSSPLQDGQRNDNNGFEVPLQEGFLSNMEGYDTLDMEQALSTVETNIQRNMIRRKMSKSEPAGFGDGIDDMENSGRESDGSQSSDQNAPTRQRPAIKLSENPPKHKRRRRRNNWRKRKDTRTNTSTQSGTEGV